MKDLIMTFKPLVTLIIGLIGLIKRLLLAIKPQIFLAIVF